MAHFRGRFAEDAAVIVDCAALVFPLVSGRIGLRFATGLAGRVLTLAIPPIVRLLLLPVAPA